MMLLLGSAVGLLLLGLNVLFSMVSLGGGRRPCSRDGGELLPLDYPPREALDPAAAWWYAFEESDGLGVHYVELGGGTLEFLSVARRHDQPDFRSSR
jgi:hypothetical protein